MSIFGSSNWTTASASSQQEHNYFTTKNAIFQWFASQFDRMWNNTNGAKATETAAFVPLPPDQPSYKRAGLRQHGDHADADAELVGRPVGAQLRHLSRHLVDAAAARRERQPRAERELDSDYVTYTTPKLLPNTTYYWRVVSKTMANLEHRRVDVELHHAGGRRHALPSGWDDDDVGAVGVAGSASSIGRRLQRFGIGRRCLGHRRRLPLRLSAADRRRPDRRARRLGREHRQLGKGRRHDPRRARRQRAVRVHARLGVKGTAFQYRTGAGASAASFTGNAAAAPTWVKLVRHGNTITASQSANGSSWTTIGSASIPMSGTIQIGLAVSSHVNSQICAATFDHVSR